MSVSPANVTALKAMVQTRVPPQFISACCRSANDGAEGELPFPMELRFPFNVAEISVIFDAATVATVGGTARACGAMRTSKANVSAHSMLKSCQTRTGCQSM